MSVLAQYSVPPFSGKDYGKKSERCKDDETPCAICGRGVKDPWPHTAAVVRGGGAWGDEKSDQNDPGWMGLWPIGNDCHRKYVIK